MVCVLRSLVIPVVPTVKRSRILERNYSFFILSCGLEQAKAQFADRYRLNLSKVTNTSKAYPQKGAYVPQTGLTNDALTAVHYL